MYLSKLELHGFKSFADRTALHFAPGTTAVVGPNGCGKSNIVDSVRWVIGEQRARVLRSEKMENVIFNGTSKRRPLGLAEVQLTIENTRGVLPTEYTEVTLGRRLYRSGESEYLLNGIQCRLKDITDLFMDTGMGAGAYSVIELKMVDEILSENPHDQRRLFEEAAGITKYKLRRRQTLGKLGSTQADLTRLRDLTEEIGKQVRSLKRQADKASRFQRYQERLRTLELTLAYAEYDRLRRQRQTLESELQALQQQTETETERMEEAEARLGTLSTTLSEQEQALAGAQQRLQEHLDAVRTLEAERQVWTERLEAARRDRERTEREAELDADRRTELEAAAERLVAEITAAEPKLRAAEKRLDEARAERDRLQAASATARDHVQTLREQVQQAEDARAGKHRTLDRLTSRLDVQTQEQRRLQDELAGLEAETEATNARLEQAAARLEEARQAVVDAQHALDAAQQNREQQQHAVQEATDALRQAERRHDAAAAEVHLLDSLVSSYDEFSDAVRFLASATGWSSREDLLTVADVLACDDEVRVALDAALGEFASCIVVASEAEAVQAAAFLRREGQGQATFLILDRLPPTPHTIHEASLRMAVRVAEPTYAPLADVLLARWILVDDLGPVLHGEAEAGCRYLTRSGEWTDAAGLFHAGSARIAPSPIAGRLGRREQLAEARAQLERWDAERTEHTQTLEAARTALDAVPYETRRVALRDAEMILNETRQAHSRAAYDAEAVQKRRTSVAERLEQLAGTLASGSDETAELEAAVAEAEATLEALRAERTAADEAFQSAEAASRSALHRFSEAHIAAVQARNQLDNLRRDRDRAKQTLADLATRAETRAAHIDELTATLAEAENRQAALAEQIESSAGERDARKQAVEAARGEVLRIKKQIGEIEGVLRGMRRAREQQMREENLRAVRLAEVKTRQEDLVASIEEDYELDLTTATIEPEEDFEEAEARKEVQELRRKVRALGGVNELALEDYETEKARYDDLVEQLEDLERAEATLLETIDEINTTAAQRFYETFEKIQTSFSRIFAELFGEDASASLSLVDEEDPLESAIHIEARPRGKRPSSITQLSGGEKTLTAIALLFAIYLVKPSPFCILDEVDAPLDDANVERFMNMIRSFANETQFILVTHNKRSMEMADRLYGVTMQEQGVSKLVSVQFDEAVEIAGV